MKPYSGKITLARNSRGCYILDTFKGCVGAQSRPHGCYGDCYAKAIAGRYGFDFETPISRDFKDKKHLEGMVKAIQKIKMPFVRIGEMGDPSYDWEHTIRIVRDISPAMKPMVIITKHFTPIPERLYPFLQGVCVNTSVSGLDTSGELAYRLSQFEKLKPWCNSVLRIVSCDFNLENAEGRARAKVQEGLMKKGSYIDTVFRPSKDNPFLVNGVIKAEKVKFLKAMQFASMNDKNAYIGPCEGCPDMCGLTLKGGES